MRRLHDTNKSGCFWFLIFAPAGIFVLLYFFLKDSDIGDNQYGPSPKYPALINPNNMQPNYIPQMSISQPQFIILIESIYIFVYAKKMTYFF